MNNSSLNNPGLTPELMAPDFSRIISIPIPYTLPEPGYIMGQAYAAREAVCYVTLNNAAIGAETGSEGGYFCYGGKGDVVRTVNASVQKLLFAPCKGNRYD